ncbi:MAG TPA: hypothetical protein VI197_19640, partial [Polyangiaceae bacterium]
MTHQHELLPLESVDAEDGHDQVRLAEQANDAPVAPAHAPTDQALDHWRAIQGKFVDDPRGSVADARALVDDLIQHVVRSFSEHRESLDRQWSSEPTVSTEQLRLCLQQYRALFTQLLPVVPPAGAPARTER